MGVSARILAMSIGFGALTSGAGACILVIPSEDLGAHCKFAGVESECGRCIADRCAPSVDGCCRNEACGGVISDVETCATNTNATTTPNPNTTAACARVADPNERSGAHADLSTCIVKECVAACRFTEDVLPASTKNQTRCQRAYVTSRETCECEIGPKPNDTECTAVGHPGLRCCAADGWPAPLRACDCLKIICVTAGGGCLCQLSAIDENDRALECTGAICCFDPLSNNCSCGTVPCRPEEKQVSTCTIDALVCPKGKSRVETCTVRKP